MSKPSVTVSAPKKRVVKKQNVAAYARISEVKGNTPLSLSTQVSYYNERIQGNPAWNFAGVYADAGITGTSTKRPQFQKMLAEAEAGHIDLILTKSISRFARNTVDLLKTVRHLTEIGVEVWFERENVKTFSGDGELMLSILASFAQEEAWSVSANVKWGIQKNFQKGITNQMCVYGYIWTGSEFLVNEKQAEAVKYIYRRFLQHARYVDIIRECESLGYEAYWGGNFTTPALKMILRQERYTGNTLLGKSFNPYPGHHGMKNTGQVPQYVAYGAQPAIIDQETWDAAQVEFERRRSLTDPRLLKAPKWSCFTRTIFCVDCGSVCYRVSTLVGTHRLHYWECRKRNKREPHIYGTPRLREDYLEDFVCLVLGLNEFSDEAYKKYVDHVVMTDKWHCKLYLRDGRVAVVPYRRGKTHKTPTLEQVEWEA